MIPCHPPRLPPKALDLSLGQLESPEDGGAEAGAGPQAETIALAAYPLLRQLISTLQQPAAMSDVPA